jgi:peptidoglycan hydrolase-like protein with peptidoglycan-binding domain
MVTGYYGAATQAAVRIYQGQHGLAQTGVADSATRASIAACGTAAPYSTNMYPSYTNTNPYSYTNNYTIPYNNNYNYNYNNNYGYPYTPYTGSVKIDSFSVTSAVTGASVTISGTNFDANNNTVYVGSVPVTNLPSYNGNALSFIVPQNVSGSVMVYVANSHGTSNSLVLNVINYGGGSGCLPGQSVYPYTIGYGSCVSAPLTVTSLSPDNGAVGSSVTVYGTGFSTTGNTVHFGSGIITNIGSNDGRAISFIVPSQLIGYSGQSVGLGVYPVSVSNSSGYTSNVLTYTVTALGGSNVPSIGTVSGPNTLSTGVAGTWSLAVNAGNSTYTSVSVRWGDEGTYGYATVAPQTTYITGTQTFTFSHTYVTSGTYTVTFTVTNLNGKSATASATVVVSGTGSGQVTLSSVTPNSGRVGTQVILQGNGFTTYDNTVHFGIGGTQHLISQNGTQIYFTIPAYLSPCDVATPSTYCAQYAQQVTPGTYQMYVTNSLGQTNQTTFTVTQ